VFTIQQQNVPMAIKNAPDLTKRPPRSPRVRLGGVFLKLLDARVFNAVTVNPDFGSVDWPGGVDLCPDALHQAMSGSESETELHSTAALREDAKRNQ
jgi:hypothetical protein